MEPAQRGIQSPETVSQDADTINVADVGPDPPKVDEQILKNPHHELPQSRKIGIMAAIVITQLVQMAPIGVGIDASGAIGATVGSSSAAESTWIAASYPLTQGSFILPGGRLGAKFGHKNILFVGAILWVAFSLASGFAHSVTTLSLFRGFSGIGGGLMIPNCVAILGITFPPGRLRNLAMGLSGMSVPVGAVTGGLICGIFVQFTHWKWAFFFLTIAGSVIFSLVFVLVPMDDPVDPNSPLDYVGTYFGVTGLILFNFVWNQAPAVGWQEPYVYILLIVAVLHFFAFAYWEMYVAKVPILPFTIWKRPSFGPMLVVLFLSFMAFGILLWYVSTWEYQTRHYTTTAIGGTFGPLAVSGACMALVSAWLVPRLAAQYVLGIGLVGIVVCSLLIATMPAQQMYWKQVFPATLLMGMGPDFVTTMSQIIAANTVKRHEQGLAGTLVGVLQTYGLSTGLGFAGTVEAHVNKGGKDPVLGYRGALYLAIGFCVLALVIDLVFVRVPKDTQEGWKEGDLDNPAQQRPTEKDPQPV
ncbi:major facilitator superfamily domain-containing protein [Gloeopeniophorella convolvens]|nr:major facilitator superfamily domain-containing protein [Gloeopeniophorella convolvens]